MFGPVIRVHEAFTGDWEADKLKLEACAQKSFTAANAALHAQVIQTLFQHLTYDTPAAPEFPTRQGLIRKVHDEIWPIAHFSNLYFKASPNVEISWHSGNQSYDATVTDGRPETENSQVKYLEVTTLQDAEDAALLKQLAASDTGIVSSEGDQRTLQHSRKLEKLKAVLRKKAKINYPEGTVLLVYTDEERFKSFYFGYEPQQLDKQGDFEKVLRDNNDDLKRFLDVVIYSRKQIYCSRLTLKQDQ